MLKWLKRFRTISLLLSVGMLALALMGFPSLAFAQTPPSVAQAAAIETVVVPGERVGPVTKSTTRQDLARLFGNAALADKEIPGAEGEVQPGTVVNLRAGRSFTVLWGNPQRTEAVAVTNLGSAWKTPEGIGVGTSFRELQQRLGEFKLYGFDWDYGGTVVLEGSQLANYDGKLLLQVAPAQDAAMRSPREYRAVTGDQLFSSTNPNFSSLGITVDQMSVYLSPQ
jgi:hypothetical protein